MLRLLLTSVTSETRVRLPCAVHAGSRGLSAMKRSRALLRPLRWQLAIPFAALLLAGRLLELGKAALLNAMPHRWVRATMRQRIRLRMHAQGSRRSEKHSHVLLSVARFYTQLIELPLAVLLGGAVLSALLAR